MTAAIINIYSFVTEVNSLLPGEYADNGIFRIDRKGIKTYRISFEGFSVLINTSPIDDISNKFRDIYSKLDFFIPDTAHSLQSQLR